EAYTGQPPFVRFWVHNGLVKMGAEKMSKSLGNVVGIDELLERHPAALIRFLLLNTHYRSPVEFSGQALAEARKGWQRLNGAFLELKAWLRDTTGGHASGKTESEWARLDEAGLRFLETVNQT